MYTDLERMISRYLCITSEPTVAGFRDSLSDSDLKLIAMRYLQEREANISALLEIKPFKSSDVALSIIENSDAMEFIKDIKDERMKSIMQRVLFAYQDYSAIGTPKEFRQCKDWSDIRPSDFMRLLDDLGKLHRDDLDSQKRYYESKIKSRRGRKKKGE